MQKLYLRGNLPDGSHRYLSRIRGPHSRTLYRRAHDAQTHSQAVLARYQQLKAEQRHAQTLARCAAQRNHDSRLGFWARLFGWHALPEVA